MILCRTEAQAQAALATVAAWVKGAGLILHPQKTRVVDATQRGGFDYFQHSKPNTFRAVDGFVRRRLRSLLQWRRDGRGQGKGAAHQRWPNDWFARGGLFSLEAAHQWTLTIVRLRIH